MKKRLRDIFRDIWEGIRSQKARVSLPFLAIAIGIAALALLLAILGGLQEKSHQMMKNLGINVVGVFHQSKTDWNNRTPLQEKHAALLIKNLPGCLFSTVHRYEVPTLGTNKQLTVLATDSSLLSIRQWNLSDGRFIDYNDIKKHERNTVISKSLSRQWNWEVGDLIMLRDVPFKVVGIVEIGGSTLNTEVADSNLMLGENIIFIPKTITPYWIISENDPSKSIDAIFWRVPDDLNMARTVLTAQSLLSQPDYRVSHLSWVTPESLIRRVKKLQKTIVLTAGSIIVLCLILGGTTLTSLMIANVGSRVKEIGLRRALGASQSDIALLFVLESCLVTGAAAVTAITTTHLFLFLWGKAFSVPLKLGFGSVFIPLVTAVILAMVSSLWPAISAARIMPSEALRNE